jgi:outer membrane protein assembly factor BamB
MEGDAYCFRVPRTRMALESDGLEQVWRKAVRLDRYYASPVIHNGLLYVLSSDPHLTVLEAETGERVYEQKIEGARGTTYPSISLVGSRLFVGVDDGTVVFVKLGREFSELSRSKIGEYRSTPIFEGTVAYLRTLDGIQAIAVN